MVTSISLLAHFTPFATGAMYLSDVGFFLSLIMLGRFLSVRLCTALTPWSSTALWKFANLLWFAGWCVPCGEWYAGHPTALTITLSRWPNLAYASGSVYAGHCPGSVSHAALVGRDVYFDSP